MKRLLIVLAAVALTASLAFAYGPGYGRMMGGGPQGYGQGGYGCDGPQGYGQGRGRGFNQNSEFKALTEKEAKVKIDKFLAENLKGAKYDKISTFEMPRGKVYSVKLTDKSGNKFVIHVNPWGNVVGPFIATDK